MFLRFSILAFAFLLSCTSIERDSVCDEKSVKYNGGCVGNVLPSSSSGIVYGDPVPYAGEVYETVVIGTQTWMGRNLNYNAAGSKCYNNDQNICKNYGRLYNWQEANSVCPPGWHLPNEADWLTLIATVGSSSTGGRYLKAESGWAGGYSENKYGFSALPGGCGDSDGNINDVGIHGYWWSYGNKYGTFSSSVFIMYYNDDYVQNRDYYDSGMLYSVRCVKD